MSKNGLKYRVYQYIFRSWALVLLFQASIAVSGETLIDKLAAEVNGSPVIFSDVMSKVRKGNLEEVSSYPAKRGDPPYQIALQDLINQKLIFEKSTDTGMDDISDERVTGFIEGMLKQRGMTMSQLKGSLANEGISYAEYFEDARKRMLIKRFQGRFILPFVKVSAKEVENYYFKMLGSSPAGVKVQLRKIVVDLSAETAADKSAKKEQLQLVLRKLEFKTPFERAAKLYSEDESRDQGGLMPLYELSEFSQVLRPAIEKLQEGEYTKPVIVGSKAYIFYLEKKSFADTDDFNKRKGQLEARLKELELRRSTVKWIQNERRRSDIRILTH